MYIPVKVQNTIEDYCYPKASISSCSPPENARNQLVLFREPLALAPNYLKSWQQMTEFQRTHSSLVAQVGQSVALPLFHDYIVEPETDPTQLRGIQPVDINRGPPSVEYAFLPSDYSEDSWSDANEVEQISTGEDSATLSNVRSSPDAPIEELLYEDETQILNDLMTDNTIDSTDKIIIYLIAPLGGPRKEIVSRVGEFITMKKQRWLFVNAALDPMDLYELEISPVTKTIAYKLNTDLLKLCLARQALLRSRANLFEILLQKRYEDYSSRYLWKDKNVSEYNSYLQRTRNLSTGFFPSTALFTPKDMMLEWDQHRQPYYVHLHQNLWAQLDEHRFVTSPMKDSLSNPLVPQSSFTHGHFAHQFRGYCLAHPSGTGKRRQLVTYIASFLQTENPVESRILILSTRDMESAWRKEMKNLQLTPQQIECCHFYSWESLHTELNRDSGKLLDDYPQYFRSIVSESTFAINVAAENETVANIQVPQFNYVRLLTSSWNLIIADDVVRGITGGKSNSEEFWGGHHDPLYSYLQNLPSPRLFCTASDYNLDSTRNVLLVGGLLQANGQTPLATNRETPKALLDHIMNKLVLKCHRQRCFAETLCPIESEAIVLRKDFYEAMAQSDYMNRYFNNPFDQDYGIIPPAKLAKILTCPESDVLIKHQKQYTNQPIYTLEDARKKLELDIVANKAYGLPLMDAKGVIYATHESRPQGQSSNLNYIRSLTASSQGLVTNFNCALCLEKQPASPNDYVVTTCGHFMCWSCLSPWLQHMKSRYGEDENAIETKVIPCVSCKTPLKETDLIRFAVPPANSSEPRAIELNPERPKPINRRKKRIIQARPRPPTLEEEDLHKSKKLRKNPPESVKQPEFQTLYGAKLQRLILWLREMCIQDLRIILFTHHKTLRIEVNNILRTEGIPITVYTGAKRDKQRILRTFSKRRAKGNTRLNGELLGKILFISDNIAYDDMDLSESCDILVHLDNCYHSIKEQETVENALLGRIQRRNRTRALKVVRFLLQESAEETQYREYDRYLKSFTEFPSHESSVQ